MLFRIQLTVSSNGSLRQRREEFFLGGEVFVAVNLDPRVFLTPQLELGNAFMTNRRQNRKFAILFLLVVSMFTLFVESSTAHAGKRRDKPNVIVIITDDQGYADVGFHGCRDIPTPNLDALAQRGTVCTDGYVTCPVCAPSRAGLLTGRYQQRSGFEDNAWSTKVGLSTDEKTVADFLKSAGYATIAIGKWHEGQLPQFRPLVRGFTDHYGFLGGGRSFFRTDPSKNVPFVPKDRDQTDLWRNENRVVDPEYITDAFGDEAVSYIENHKDQPFFIYLAFNAPHLPLQATEKYLNRFPNIANEQRRTFAAMVSAVDDAVGRITAKVTSEGLDDQTLIFFLSDNGGPTDWGANNGPLRGKKGTIYEGGIRVPFVVKWTGHVPAGTKYSQPIISLDIAATAVAAAGIESPAEKPFDGVNLVPYLNGDTAKSPHDTLYWRFIDHAAIRHGKWKLAMPNDAPEGQLFDLSNDISESKDLLTAQPDVVRELHDLYAKWTRELPPPRKDPARPLPK